MVEELLIGKYRDDEQNKIQFEYRPVQPDSVDIYGYRVQFIISIFDEQNEFKDYYTHTFIFDSRLNWQFDPSNDIDRTAFLNLLRDLVTEGNYTTGIKMDINSDVNAFGHWLFEGKPSDRYNERLIFFEDERRVTYTRIPDAIVKENSLARFLIIKNLYGMGGKLLKENLQEIIDIDEDIFNRNLQFLKDLNLVKTSDTAWEADEPVRLTAEGELFYERQFQRYNRNVFVIMNSDKYQRIGEFYEAELKELGLEPYFRCEKQPSNEIIPDIYNSLRNCMFILADLTGVDENSLFELGYVHALGKRLIIARSDEEINGEDTGGITLPFYLYQFRHSMWFRNKGWDDPENEKFKADIRERIRQAKEVLTREQFNLEQP